MLPLNLLSIFQHYFKIADSKTQTRQVFTWIKILNQFLLTVFYTDVDNQQHNYTAKRSQILSFQSKDFTVILEHCQQAWFWSEVLEDFS